MQGEEAEGGKKSKGSKVGKIQKEEVLLVRPPPPPPIVRVDRWHG